MCVTKLTSYDYFIPLHLETVPNHDFGRKSGKISLETVTFGTKTSILVGTQARMAGKNRMHCHRIKSSPHLFSGGIKNIFPSGMVGKNYSPHPMCCRAVNGIP